MAVAATATPPPDQSTAAAEARLAAREAEFARLQGYFRGAARVQLKPLAHVLGVSDRTVRNRGNRLEINGVAILPVVIAGRLTYDLTEVAGALALGRLGAEAAAAAPPRPRVGRPRKPGLTLAGLPASLATNT